MGLELLLFALAGCILGIATGLTPGLHVNTVALIALGMPKHDSLCWIVLISSMSVVHTFVDFIPSVLLGAPDSDTFLSVLPGHRLLLQGKGLVAVRLTIVGGLFAGIASIAAAPLFVLFMRKAYQFLSSIVPLALGLILVAMVLGEKGNKKRAFGLAAVFLSGFIGLLALKSTLPLHQPLFCLATGFFGASMLVDSFLKKPKILEQTKSRFSIGKGRAAKNSLLALVGGCFVSLMPSVGASQAAFVMRKMVGRIKTADYLILLGGVNTSTAILSFFVLFAWGKTRTGAAAAISQLAEFGLRELLLVVGACIIGLGFGAIATDLISRRAMKAMQAANYRKINLGVLALVTGLVFFFSGFLGLAFYATAASIGVFSINAGIKRSNSMAFLMIPTILYYLGLA